MRVLGVIPDTEVRMVEECSAVDGAWGMKPPTTKPIASTPVSSRAASKRPSPTWW
jgi:hypothetical protein